MCCLVSVRKSNNSTEFSVWHLGLVAEGNIHVHFSGLISVRLRLLIYVVL